MEQCVRKFKNIDLVITSSTPTVLGSVIIIIPPQNLIDKKEYEMLFCVPDGDIAGFNSLIVGTEIVSIRNGSTGTIYVLEDKAGDRFFSQSLKCGYCYALRFGNDGPTSTAGTTGGVGHFLNLNTPCCARRFNPANIIIPPTED